MFLPIEAHRFRIENYRDLKELVDFAELIDMPLTEAAAAAIEEGRMMFITVCEFETYLYLCNHCLRPIRLVEHAKPKPRAYVMPPSDMMVATRKKLKKKAYDEARKKAKLAP